MKDRRRAPRGLLRRLWHDLARTLAAWATALLLSVGRAFSPSLVEDTSLKPRVVQVDRDRGARR